MGEFLNTIAGQVPEFPREITVILKKDGFRFDLITEKLQQNPATLEACALWLRAKPE
jgi:hypothetical protein